MNSIYYNAVLRIVLNRSLERLKELPQRLKELPQYFQN